jgi:hypothetical protein
MVRNDSLKDDLIDSNVLFEGSDWDEWKESLFQLCRVHDIFEFQVEENRLEEALEEGCTREEYMEWQEPILSIIRCHVQPSLMSRTSKDLTPSELLPVLKMLATPFRLSDMPEELQVRVFRYAFQPSHSYIGPALRLFAYKFPALLQSSSQIRRASCRSIMGKRHLRHVACPSPMCNS